MNLQVVGSSLRRAETVLRETRTLASERSVSRGQVISFGPDILGPGVGSTPLSFLPRAAVTRNQLVLPAVVLLLDSRSRLTRVLLGGQQGTGAGGHVPAERMPWRLRLARYPVGRPSRR